MGGNKQKETGIGPFLKKKKTFRRTFRKRLKSIFRRRWRTSDSGKRYSQEVIHNLGSELKYRD